MALINLDAGSTTVNVNGGSYTSNARVFIVKNGTLNINAGTIKATGTRTAIWVQEPAVKYTNALNIKGGEITSASSVEEAIWFDGSKGTYSIANVKVTSGKDAKGNRLPALHIRNKDFLDNHKAMVTSGTFAGSLVGDVEDKDGRHVDSENATAILVGNATTTTENGIVTVNPSKAEDDKKPAAKPEEQAPNTYDAGLVYMGLALSAIGASVVSVRKLRNN